MASDKQRPPPRTDQLPAAARPLHLRQAAGVEVQVPVVPRGAAGIGPAADAGEADTRVPVADAGAEEGKRKLTAEEAAADIRRFFGKKMNTLIY